MRATLGRLHSAGYILGLVFALLGCGSGEEHATVIEFWAMGREGEMVQSLLPEFERRYPAIRVRVQQIPWSVAHEKLLTAYAGDVMPDVFQVGNTWIPEFVALHAVEKLDTLARRSAKVQLEDYFPGILKTNRLDGFLYALPWYVDTRLLFYRQDILARAGVQELPTNWAHWLEVLRRVKDYVGAERYALLLPFDEWQPLVILALQLNAELLQDDDQYGAFREARFRRAFSFYLDLFRNGLAPASGSNQIANIYQEFANGYFSMLITGPWNIGEFKRRLPAAVLWSTAPLPAPDGEYPGVSLAGGGSLAISSTSRYKEAAWKLLEFLSEPTQQLDFYHLTGDLPSRKTSWQQPELAAKLEVQAFWTQLQHLKATPRIPEWERIAAKISQYCEAVVRENLTVDEALEALDRDVDAILEKRRWLLSRAHLGIDHRR